jgi:16S rRNA (uracil1498-N3)-methyltransferase
MLRFFSPQKNISKDQILITDSSQIHHLKDVLRKKVDDQLEILDEFNNVYECRIKAISKESVTVKINKIRELSVNRKAKIALACAIPKKNKFDFIVEKTTELGVDRIIPLITSRTIVKLDEAQALKKVSRWQKISLEAAKQSKRISLPVIDTPIKFTDLAKNFKDFDCLLMPNLSSIERINFLDLSKKTKDKNNILLLIGPEGDFTNQEIELAKNSNALMISLGDTVLKVETAAIVCVGMLTILNK